MGTALKIAEHQWMKDGQGSPMIGLVKTKVPFLLQSRFNNCSDLNSRFVCAFRWKMTLSEIQEMKADVKRIIEVINSAEKLSNHSETWQSVWNLVNMRTFFASAYVTKKRFSSKFEFKVILIYLYFYATCRVWSFWSTLWTPYPPSVKGSKIQVNLIKENRFVHEWSTKSSKSNFSSYIRQRVSFGLQCSFTALKNLTHHRVHSKIVPRYPK